MLSRNIDGLSLEQALDAAGGFRSILGILKHVASWSHVYRSYAFDDEPKHVRSLAWPRGLSDTIEASAGYMREVVDWWEGAAQQMKDEVSREPDEAFDQQRPRHWGATAPLREIVLMVADHWTYHAGEIKCGPRESGAARRGSIRGRRESHISTAGHRIKPQWMSQEQMNAYEAFRAGRDAQLHGAAARGRGT